MEKNFSKERQNLGDDDVGVVQSPAGPTMLCCFIRLQCLPKKNIVKDHNSICDRLMSQTYFDLNTVQNIF